LRVVAGGPPEFLGGLNRWPDYADLQNDPRFVQMLIANRVQ